MDCLASAFPIHLSNAKAPKNSFRLTTLSRSKSGMKSIHDHFGWISRVSRSKMPAGLDA